PRKGCNKIFASAGLSRCQPARPRGPELLRSGLLREQSFAGELLYSSGKVTPPSTLQLIDGKLPVESDTFISGPNALKLQWTSAANGGWSAEVKLHEARKR